MTNSRNTPATESWALTELKPRCWGTTAYLRPGLNTACSGIRIPPFQGQRTIARLRRARRPLPRVRGRPPGEYGPQKKASRSAGLKLWR